MAHHTIDESAASVRQFCESELKTYWQKKYSAYCEGHETDIPLSLCQNPLTPLQISQNRDGIPQRALDAYKFYDEHVMQQDWGSVTLARVAIADQDTYVIRVTTDGDDGWLEVFDPTGKVLGAARAYLELVSWGEIKAIRAAVDTGEYPAELEARLDSTLWGR